MRVRWTLVAVAVWAVVLLVAGGLSGVFGAPTVPEQRNLSDGLVGVDKTVGVLAEAAHPLDAAIAVTGFDVRSVRCRISLARTGMDYQRYVYLYTRPYAEIDLLRQVADRLPDRYHSKVEPGPEGSRLIAVGDGLTQIGGRPLSLGSGRVRLTITTGCRPTAQTPAIFESPATSAERGTLGLLLTGAGLEATDWRSYQFQCSSGLLRAADGALDITVGGSGSLADRVTPPSGAQVLVAGTDLVAYRDGAESVVIDVGNALAATTTGCR